MKLASTYTSTTPITPITSARGRFRSGAMISSAMKLVCCQPPQEKRTGTSAAPMARTTLSGARSASAGAAAGSSPAAAASPAAITAPSATSLRMVKMFWVMAPGRTPV